MHELIVFSPLGLRRDVVSFKNAIIMSHMLDKKIVTVRHSIQI